MALSVPAALFALYRQALVLGFFLAVLSTHFDVAEQVGIALRDGKVGGMRVLFRQVFFPVIRTVFADRRRYLFLSLGCRFWIIGRLFLKARH